MIDSSVGGDYLSLTMLETIARGCLYVLLRVSDQLLFLIIIKRRNNLTYHTFVQRRLYIQTTERSFNITVPLINVLKEIVPLKITKNTYSQVVSNLYEFIVPKKIF